MGFIRQSSFLVVLSVASASLSQEPARAASPDPHYCDSQGRCSDHYVAFGFVDPSALDPRQEALLAAAVPGSYVEWAEANDSEAATFLSVSRALLIMQVKVGKNAWVPFLDLVKGVNRFGSDRLYAALDKALFDKWRGEFKGEFKIRKANGKTESGKFKFASGTSGGGSLHAGYDIQASTSVKDVPRIQINYRFSDGEADIDLDGYAPWKWGVIPNPNHLTYANSDVRQWFDSFVKKFGDPGFRVRPH